MTSKRGMGAKLKSREGMVFAIDPGGTTGIAWGISGKVSDVMWEEVGGDEVVQVKRIVSFIRKVAPKYVVIEDSDHFLLRGGTNLRKGALIPVRVTAMLEYALERKWFNGRILRQTPSQAKGVVTDVRLRTQRLWVSGHPHARDAIRHLILFHRRLRSGKIK